MEDIQSVNVPSAEESELYLTTFGHSVTGPGHRYGPAVRSYYLIHFILAGKGTFQANQHTYHLHAGQGFLIEPDYQTTYQSDEADPWTYIWVACSGRRAPEIIASLGLSQEGPIYTCTKEQGARLTSYVEDMLAHNSFTLSGRYYRMGLLMQFLSVLAEAQRDLMPASDSNTYITHMTAFIRTHLEEPFTVQDLADYMNLNRSYVTTLFKKHLGISPHTYIENEGPAPARDDDLLHRVDCLFLRLRQERLLPARLPTQGRHEPYDLPQRTAGNPPAHAASFPIKKIPDMMSGIFAFPG